MTNSAEPAKSIGPPTGSDTVRKWRPDDPISLDDKYTKERGRVLLNGTQALVRMLLMQRQRDAAAGLNTAGFVSGYRGSPLGTFDMTLWRAKGHLQKAQVTFKPGVNEELAATAIWGTQQINSLPNPTVDGVFGIWYGKGPGVDRSGDVFKHANHQGAHPKGGVLVVCGDDHPGKSSTVSHQSEQALTAALIPCLYPSSVQEFLEFGLKGWALSRYSGLWVGFKVVNETIEQTATVDLDMPDIQLPDRSDLAEASSGVMGYIPPIQREISIRRKRLPLVHRFVRANQLDRQTMGAISTPLGIVSAGKSYQDVLQALRLLRIDEARAQNLGLAVYKVGCVWPLEPQGIREFARGRRELMFVEEKAAFVEPQAAEVLYNQPERPAISGKRDPSGNTLLPEDVQLEPRVVAHAIVSRLDALGLADDELRTQWTSINAGLEASSPGVAPINRIPYFCSGCPHNTSTKLPEGSFAMAGIGCHGMAVLTRKDTMFPGQMGGEGANWIGLSHYTKTPHIFQNLGDGTYYHSGTLAIRAAVAAGINITYKILYNEAVAMTGGQPVDGPISVEAITRQVMDEGVKRCVLVTDNPAAYDANSSLAPGIEVRHRDDLDLTQREFREIPGCTIIVYEQTCAAEKRRKRKRKRMVDPPKRMFINDAVCEGCGDCSVQSTCVSIQPLMTDFGLKRRIDQSSCNKDYSCAKGFCPSFVTVLDAEPRKPSNADVANLLAESISPPASSANLSADGVYNVMIAGVGGTGVITVGAVLAMAAYLEGQSCSVYDMTGLSQKNGAVYGHLRIAASNAALAAQRLGAGDAHLVLAFDLIAALSGDALPTYRKGQTQVVGDARVTPTAAFQFNPDGKVDTRMLQARLAAYAGENNCDFVDATGMAIGLCGDTIAANFFLVGYALQRGLLPVGVEMIEKAIELNGVSVALNKRAMALGRLWAHAPETIREHLARAQGVSAPDDSLDALINRRKEFLTAYHDVTYAGRYESLVRKVRVAEHKVTSDSEALSRAVAKYYAKLLAYKDEYEVARLYADPAFLAKLRDQFEPGFKLRLNLAPPLLAKRDPVTGHLRKREFGPWILVAFRVLARFRTLRGTKLDIFGYSPERRTERRLIQEYEQLIEKVLTGLTPANHAVAVELAELPEHVRGYGHIKERHIAAVRQRQADLETRLRQAPSGQDASQGVSEGAAA